MRQTNRLFDTWIDLIPTEVPDELLWDYVVHDGQTGAVSVLISISAFFVTDFVETYTAVYYNVGLKYSE